MNIKKAVYHQSFYDSPRLRDKQTRNSSLNQKNIDKIHKQLKQLDKLSNKDINNLQSEKKEQTLRNSAAQLLARILKKSIIQQKNPIQCNFSFFNSPVLSPQQVISSQSGQKLRKNKSEMFPSQKMNKKIILDRIRRNNNKSFDAFNKLENCNERKQNLIKINQQNNENKSIKKPSTFNKKSAFENLQSNSNQKIMNQVNPRFQQQNSDIKSKNQIKTQKSQNFITLTTIKQRIEKYLSEQQQKIKFLNNKNLYANNKSYQSKQLNTNNEVLKQKQPDLNTKNSRGQIFSQLSSLIKRKQSKHAFEMMKRKLNFSVINKPVMQKQCLSQNGQKSLTTLSRRRKSFNQQETNFQKLKIQNFHLNEQEEQLENQILNQIKNNPEILKSFESQMINNSEKQTKQIQVNLTNKQLDSKKALHASQNISENIQSYQSTRVQDKSYSKLAELSQSNSGLFNESVSKKSKTKQYLYNLYYYPLIQKKQEPKTGQQIEQKNQRYIQWKKQKKTEQKLKDLLKYNSDPIDPLKYYENSFVTTKAHLKSLNTMLSNKSPTLLYPSNSLNPINQQKSNNFFTNQQNYRIQLNKKIQEQKIIFVSKKHKQNLQQKKLSNLLQKIEKRNSQIQRLGQIQVVQIFKTQKKQRKKFNTGNIKVYIEEQDPMGLASPQSKKKIHNFILSPKKSEGNAKGKKQTKKAKEDWTEFEPWTNQGIHQNLYDSNYQKLLKQDIKL